MSVKLFDQEELAVEDFAVEVKPMSVESVIETQEAFDVIADIEKEYMQTTVAVDSAKEVVAGLESNVDYETGLLATPEKVTPSLVAMAQESYKVAATALGAEANVATLSVEAIEASPVRALELGIEEKQSFIQRVVESIKVLFKKFTGMFKKLYTKAVVAMTGVAKQADALAKEIADAKDLKTVTVGADSKLNKLILGKMSAAVSFTEPKKLADLNPETILSKNVMVTPNEISELTPVLVNAIDGVTFDESVKGTEVSTALDGVLDKISTKLGNKFNNKAALVAYSGANAKVIQVTFGEIDKNKTYSKESAFNAIAKINFIRSTEKPSALNTKYSDTPKLDGFSDVTPDDMVAAAKLVIPAASDIKGYSKKIEDAIKTAQDEVEKIGKKDNGEAEDKKYLPVTKYASTLISGVGMDMILGKLSIIKAYLSIVKAAYAEAKGDKKEEDKK